MTFQGFLIIFRFSVCCFTSMHSVGVAPIYDIRTYNLWSMYLCINKSVISVINKSIISPEQGDTFLFYAQLIRSQIFTTTTMMFSSFTHKVRPSACIVLLLRSVTASTGILYLPLTDLLLSTVAWVAQRFQPSWVLSETWSSSCISVSHYVYRLILWNSAI